MTSTRLPTSPPAPADPSASPAVLMVAPGPFFVDRGFGVAVYEQARALQARGVQAEVVCYHSGRDVPAVPVHRAAPFPGYDATRVGPSLARVPHWALLLSKTWRVARRRRPDLLHGHLHEGALIACIVSRATGIPWLFDYQGSLTTEMAEKRFLRAGALPLRLLRALEGRIDRAAPRILVRAAMMREDLEQRFRVAPGRIAPVLDGTDPETFAPRPADPALRARLGIAPDAIVIGYLGLLTAQQGVERLLRAAALVVEAEPRCRFLVMGFPVDEAQRLARALGLERAVTLTGRIDYFAAPHYLALAHLAVAPKVSRTEGNGKVYNYMSMALPVVAIDSPVNRELLGEDGYYAPGETVEAFASALLDALRSRDEWPERGRRLRARLEERFTWHAVASRLLAVYRELAPSAFARAVG